MRRYGLWTTAALLIGVLILVGGCAASEPPAGARSGAGQAAGSVAADPAATPSAGVALTLPGTRASDGAPACSDAKGDCAAHSGGPGVVSKLKPGDLAAMLKSKDFQLINVHIPYAGEIEGTDALLPYDRIETDTSRLPAEKGAKIVLYCRSGAMSAIAARSLAKLGYTNVYDLEGGMAAWEAAGYQLVTKAQ